MNSFVCSMILISLFLGNVASYIGELPRVPAPPVAHHPIEIIKYIDSSKNLKYFKCNSEDHYDHQWFHVYPNGNRKKTTYTGNIPKQKSVKTTQYIITLETFDNNTEIHCDTGRNVKIYDYLIKLVSSNLNVRSIYQPNIFITNEIFKDPAHLKYNETQKVSFKCQEYKDKTNLVIGVINTTTKMIKTYNKTFLYTIFNKSQNGTGLCCIYYAVSGPADEKWITRHVVKKTLLVYDDTVTVPVSDRQNISEEKDKSKQDAGLTNQATIIYIVSAVAVGFILLVGTVIYLKRCREKPKAEVETKVLYADLDLLRRNEPESLPREGPQEESPYAQIIGELRPQ